MGLQKKYSEADLERTMEEASKYGAVRTFLYFDAHSKDEQALKAALVDFVSRLSGQQGILYCKGEILEAIKQEVEGQEEFTSSAKVDVVTDSFNTMLNLCLRFAPMAVEIISPPKIQLNGEQAQTVLLDASRAAQDYAESIYSKLLKPEDFKKLSKALRERIEAGKALLEKANKEKQS